MDSKSVEPESSNTRSWITEALMIAAFALTLHLIGNDRSSLWDRDEPRYAGCTREMLAGGDWLHPFFNAEPRYHKPVLIYWLMAGAMALGGENPFAARFVSAIAGTGTCLLVWMLGRWMSGPRVGRWAACMAATAPLLVYNAKAATTDAALTFFLTLSFVALWRLTQAESKRWAAVFWIAAAAATLTKGPVGPGIVIVAMIASIIWGGSRAFLSRLQWKWGPLVYFALAAPWFIAIAYISKGKFYEVAMGRHVIHRMTNPMEEHGGFPGFYLVATMIVMFPWSPFLFASLWSAWRERREKPQLAFLAGWILGPLILLELIRTKLIHYYMPAMPGIVLLVATWLDQVATSQLNLRRWPMGRLSIALSGLLGITFAAFVGALALNGPPGIRPPSLALALVIALGLLWSLERLMKGATISAVRGAIGAISLCLVIVYAWLLPSLEPYRLTQKATKALAEVAAETHAQPMLAEFKPPGIVWEFGRPIPVMENHPSLRLRVLRDGPVVTLLTADGWAHLRHDPRLTLEERAQIEGFDIEKARWNKVRLVVIRPSGDLAARPRVEQPGVK